ncbi:hypothetical protein PWT90_10047 [Aphanocladium album]|nr:hypothetical protein PWT90_10047 [Aphanocladium album]
MPRTLELLKLPTELIRSIVWQLDDEASIFSIARTCHLLFDISIEYLYLFNCDKHEGSAIDWATQCGQIGVLQRVARLGLAVHSQDRLMMAVCSDNLEVLQFLLQSSPTDWLLETVDTLLSEGISLVEVVSGRGDLKMVQELLNFGVAIEGESAPSAVHTAASYGYSEVVHLLLDYGADGAVVDSARETPLHAAIHGEHQGVVEVLLNWNSVLVNSAASDLRTPLHLAATIGALGILKLLLEHNADVAVADDEGLSPFLAAVQHNQIQAAMALLDGGSEVGNCTKDDIQSTALHLASRNGNTEMMKMLLDRGTDPSAVDANGWTPFAVAVNKNHVEAAKLLLANGVDVNAPDGQIKSPALCEAARQGNIPMAKLLLKHGADMEGTDRIGYTALVRAANNGHVAMVRYLLNRGANNSHITKSKWTAFDGAAQEGSVELATLLLNHVTARGGTVYDLHGFEPMHTACANGHVDFVKLLLQHQPEAISKPKENGQLPIHAAAEAGELEMLQYLLTVENGPGMDAIDPVGRTPLFFASRYGCISIVQFLLDNKASTEIKDRYGTSAVSTAARNGHGRVLKRLIPANPAVLLWQDSFGHTPFWWASRCGSKKFVKLVKRLALENGLSEKQLEVYNGPKQLRSFDADESWCDVCTRPVENCKSAAHCTSISGAPACLWELVPVLQSLETFLDAVTTPETPNSFSTRPSALARYHEAMTLGKMACDKFGRRLNLWSRPSEEGRRLYHSKDLHGELLRDSDVKNFTHQMSLFAKTAAPLNGAHADGEMKSVLEMGRSKLECFWELMAQCKRELEEQNCHLRNVLSQLAHSPWLALYSAETGAGVDAGNALGQLGATMNMIDAYINLIKEHMSLVRGMLS